MLLEVLITIVLLSVGLIGLAGFQARTAVAEIEAFQRTQALLLAQDMAERIAANKTGAVHYVGDDYGVGAVSACGTVAGFERDRCTWSQAIRGATEKAGASDVGTLLAGRGCVVAMGAGRYHVIVSWQGMGFIVPPTISCGSYEAAAGATRRAILLPIHLPDLGGA